MEDSKRSKDSSELNPKCPSCGSASVWAGENRYLCGNGCTAVGGFRPIYMELVKRSKERFKRDES
jgi:ribosomal protein S27AE